LLVVPRFTRLLPPDAPAPVEWLVRSIATTCGATAGTLPVVAWRFQQLAPLAPLANLAAAPVVGSLVVPAALLAARLPRPLAAAPLWIADHALDLVLALLHLLDREPWSPAVGPGGALLLALALLLRRRSAAAVLLAVVALGLRAWPVHRLTVTILGIGQGDASLVEWPDGRRWLIDGGPRRGPVLAWLRRRGIDHLDGIALSHPHPDHSTGLVAVAEQLPFESLWLPRRPRSPTGDDWRLWSRAATTGATVHLADDDPPTGIRIEHPLAGWTATGRDAVNEESLVLSVGLGCCSALFTGDIEEDAERTLAWTLPPATLVKVPHHGSRTSSSAGLVGATRPAVAVISAGAGNRYGHPHAPALARWLFPRGGGDRSGPEASRQPRARPPPPCGGTDHHAGRRCRPRLLRTDQAGTVEWSTDGRRWWLRTWRADRGWQTVVGGAPTG
ncbi:MAG: MBL fold metallo-hydrolase, partial [Deltaproteobacteria bacterium]